MVIHFCNLYMAIRFYTWQFNSAHHGNPILHIMAIQFCTSWPSSSAHHGNSIQHIMAIQFCTSWLFNSAHHGNPILHLMAIHSSRSSIKIHLTGSSNAQLTVRHDNLIQMHSSRCVMTIYSNAQLTVRHDNLFKCTAHGAS